MTDHDQNSETALAMRAALDATAALNRISSHEAECARRYGDMAISISRFHSRMDQFVTAQEAAEKETRDRREKWDRDDRDRRELRDRDTRQTLNQARLAAIAGAFSLLGIIASIVVPHLWK